MKKVYLAKSNKCNPDHIFKVREILNDSNSETVEYKGGSFSHKPMLDCDMLVVLPDLSTYDDGYKQVSVGKGLYQQIEVFQEEHPDKPIYVIHDCDDGWDPNISTITDMEIEDYDDYIEYGFLSLENKCDMYENLSSILEDEFGGLDEETWCSRRPVRKLDKNGNLIYPKIYLVLGNY